MMRIEAIVRREKKWDVAGELMRAGVPYTLFDVEGIGGQLGVTMVEGKAFQYPFHEKAAFVIVVPEEDVERVCGIIVRSAYTGKPGDGKIFVSEVKRSIKIRTAGG
ncbi:MAG: P-II family nitrogen regulator [Euryarchaeota archaeon]|nr:P-II family nitrogen regulator [Euryarchaeota archaeon]